MKWASRNDAAEPPFQRSFDNTAGERDLSDQGEGLKTPRLEASTRRSKMRFGVRGTLPDPDPVATQEWIDSILPFAIRLARKKHDDLLLSTVDAARTPVWN